MADSLEVVANRPDPKNIPDMARRIVFDVIRDKIQSSDLHITFSEDEVFVVWFAYILGGWKALVSTTIPDGRYYEVTFDKEKACTYVDAYMKVENFSIPINHTT